MDTPLSAFLFLPIEGPQAHYLTQVMRLREGDRLLLCDDQSGEWSSILGKITRNEVIVQAQQHLRPREILPDLWLLFAPIKAGRIDWLVEKATELGVSRMRPIFTRRTNISRVNLLRLAAHAREAAEQCGRTALPEIDPPRSLADLLASWPEGRRLYFADEAGGAPLADAVAPDPAAILIGPEGGFEDKEREAIRALPDAIPVSLGPRILRADTAALAAITLWMSQAGDWRDGSQSGGAAPTSPS